MLIDDVTISVAAGAGGKGAIAFDRNKMARGPTGGSGGNGGNIFLEGASDLSLLNQFRFKKSVEAESGKDGRPQFVDGKTGRDLILTVPVGTVIHNLTTAQDMEIVRVGERIRIAAGGHGGKGNFLFRSPHDTSPKRFQFGCAGESFTIRFELKLIADVGLIGLPNTGKSSLLNELTRANVKVANYPFTTLEPNLGAYYGLILADIPGLIEGASVGKGLGHKFLRHIERTRTIFHLVAADSVNPIRDYETVRRELHAHQPALLEKEEYLFLSKSDMADAATLHTKRDAFVRAGREPLLISIHDVNSLDAVRGILRKIQEEKTDQG